MAFLLWNMFITESNTVACQFCQHNRPRPVPLTSFFSCNSCLKENSFCEYVQSKYCLLILLLTAIVTLLVLWNLLKRKNHEESSIVSEKEEDIIIEKLISKLKTRDEFIFKDNQSKYIKNCRMVCDDVPKADKQSFDLPQDDENSKKEDMKLAAELIETLEKETFQNSEVQDLDEKIKSIEATIKYMKSKMDSKGVGDDSIIELNKQKEIGEKFEDKKDKTTSTELNVISKTILADFEDNLNLSYNENTKISNIEKSDVDEIEYKDKFFERDLKTDLQRKLGDLKQKRKHKLEPNVAKSNTILLSKPKLYSETGKHFEEKKKEIPSTEQDIISQDIKANLEDKINSTYTENKVNNNLEKAVKEKVVNQKPNQSESLEKTKENSQNFQEDLKNMLDKYFSGQSSTLKIRKEKKYDEEKNNENYQVPYPGEEKNDFKVSQENMKKIDQLKEELEKCMIQRQILETNCKQKAELTTEKEQPHESKHDSKEIVKRDIDDEINDALMENIKGSQANYEPFVDDENSIKKDESIKEDIQNKYETKITHDLNYEPFVDDENSIQKESIKEDIQNKYEKKITHDLNYEPFVDDENSIQKESIKEDIQNKYEKKITHDLNYEPFVDDENSIQKESIKEDIQNKYEKKITHDLNYEPFVDDENSIQKESIKEDIQNKYETKITHDLNYEPFVDDENSIQKDDSIKEDIQNMYETKITHDLNYEPFVDDENSIQKDDSIKEDIQNIYETKITHDNADSGIEEMMSDYFNAALDDETMVEFKKDLKDFLKKYFTAEFKNGDHNHENHDNRGKGEKDESKSIIEKDLKKDIESRLNNEESSQLKKPKKSFSKLKERFNKPRNFFGKNKKDFIRSSNKEYSVSDTDSNQSSSNSSNELGTNGRMFRKTFSHCSSSSDSSRSNKRRFKEHLDNQLSRRLHGPTYVKTNELIEPQKGSHIHNISSRKSSTRSDIAGNFSGRTNFPKRTNEYFKQNQNIGNGNKNLKKELRTQIFEHINQDGNSKNKNTKEKNRKEHRPTLSSTEPTASFSESSNRSSNEDSTNKEKRKLGKDLKEKFVYLVSKAENFILKTYPIKGI